MYKVLLTLGKFFLKYEGGWGSNWPPISPQENLPSKSPALSGFKHCLFGMTDTVRNIVSIVYSKYMSSSYDLVYDGAV